LTVKPKLNRRETWRRSRHFANPLDQSLRFSAVDKVNGSLVFSTSDEAPQFIQIDLNLTISGSRRFHFNYCMVSLHVAWPVNQKIRDTADPSRAKYSMTALINLSI
jgi:hypothetical protein